MRSNCASLNNNKNVSIMPPVKDVSRIERESSLLFGLKWSFVGFAIALSFLAGCSSLFDHGPDRYNVVSGPRRPPPMNPGTMGAGQGTQSFHVQQNGYGQQQQPMYPAQGMPPQQQMAAQYPAGQSPYDTMHGEMESESWWDGWFDWFGDDEEMYQAAPPAYAGYGAPAAQPITPPRMAQYQAQPQPQPYQQPMMQQPQMAMPPAMPSYVPPMPTPQAARPAMPAAQAAPMLQPQMPQAVPQAQANMRNSVEAQIAELERELAASEQRRQQLNQQNDGWLPDLGISNMFDSTPQPQPQPQFQPYAAPAPAPAAQSHAPAYMPPGGGGYKVVKLPPPPPRDGRRAAPAPQLRAGLMAPNMAPQMSNAPMPPVVSEPRRNPMQHAPVMQTNQPSIDVPLAPGVTASSKPSNVPSGLIPPESFTQPKAGYLGESRYSSRY
ncbi:MAG: hypothetical protein MRY32_06100 [Rickettsiales bacterium]|nr:hypothetical protein [Rickettsiales bacterium]